MRKYKHLKIPDRHLRTLSNIGKKQLDYCLKSNCGCDFIDCDDCLFDDKNIEFFKEWYMNKNKKQKKGE